MSRSFGAQRYIKVFGVMKVVGVVVIALSLPVAAMAGQGDNGPDNDPRGRARSFGDGEGKALGIVAPESAKALHGDRNRQADGSADKASDENGSGDNGSGRSDTGANPSTGGLLGAPKAASNRGSYANLSYHNGPVMRTGNTTYAIYWIPAGYSVSVQYQPLINQFFADVAVDGGKSTNTYFSDTQYYDTTGKISVASSFSAANSVVSTDPFPASGCTDTITDTSVCLSDAQLAAQITKVAASKGWTPGPSKLFFIFTPQGVGSCAGSSCAYSHFCAYHSWSGSGASVLLYANQPYAAHAGCDTGVRPNGDDADATINVTSHEHNEAITDPQGSAWYDRQGSENADKCAWNFGTSLNGSTGTTQYNQLINGHRYYLQQNWSNASSRCVLTGT